MKRPRGKGWLAWMCDACKVNVAFWFNPAAMARLQIGNVYAKCERCVGLNAANIVDSAVKEP